MKERGANGEQPQHKDDGKENDICRLRIRECSGARDSTAAQS